MDYQASTLQAAQNQSGWAQQAPAPKEPSICGRANEILNHLATAEMHLANFRSVAFGEGQESYPNPPQPSSIDSMLALACTRIALICGQLSTINERVGTVPANELKTIR